MGMGIDQMGKRNKMGGGTWEKRKNNEILI
jgi:hypothetical protein